MNEMSGSRGEANFVWKCKNCKRESSATIKAAPTSYEISEPPKGANIIEVDCRGLEFTEFKPEVGVFTSYIFEVLTPCGRASGSPMESSRVPSLPASTWLRESGLTMMKRLGTR